jgi:hypothetical protein
MLDINMTLDRGPRAEHLAAAMAAPTPTIPNTSTRPATNAALGEQPRPPERTTVLR